VCGDFTKAMGGNTVIIDPCDMCFISEVMDGDLISKRIYDKAKISQITQTKEYFGENFEKVKQMKCAIYSDSNKIVHSYFDICLDMRDDVVLDSLVDLYMRENSIINTSSDYYKYYSDHI
jgi:hypothetical protein